MRTPGLVSQVYFGVGLVSMIYSLLVPSITRIIPRRWMFTLGCLGYAASSLLAGFGSGHLVAMALLGIMLSAVTVFICFNAYVLDYVASVELGRSETLRMFYSATAWCLGPAGGVLLLQWWRPAPFLIAVLAAFGLLVIFWWMRLGNGRLVVSRPRSGAQSGRVYRPLLRPTASHCRVVVRRDPLKRLVDLCRLPPVSSPSRQAWARMSAGSPCRSATGCCS